MAKYCKQLNIFFKLYMYIQQSIILSKAMFLNSLDRDIEIHVLPPHL